MLSPIFYYKNSYLPAQDFIQSNVKNNRQDLCSNAFNVGDSTANFGSLIIELQNNSALEKVVLNCNSDISEDQLNALENVLNENATLKVMEIVHSSRSTTTFQVLTTILKTAKNIEVLRLTGWPNGSSQVTPLANLIAENLTLRVLEIGYPVIFPADITEEFAQALASIPNLEILTLYCKGSVIDNRVEILANALESNQNLKVLKLCGESIWLKDALTLLKSKTIVELVLPKIDEEEELDSYPTESEEDALIELEKLLLETLESNRILLSLDINLDFVSCETRDKCAEYLTRNKKLFYDHFVLLGMMKDIVKGKEDLPKDIIQLIFNEMFGAYLNRYSEPEESEGTTWRGEI